jgi:hypothetical protein
MPRSTYLLPGMPRRRPRATKGRRISHGRQNALRKRRQHPPWRPVQRRFTVLLMGSDMIGNEPPTRQLRKPLPQLQQRPGDQHPLQPPLRRRPGQSPPAPELLGRHLRGSARQIRYDLDAQLYPQLKDLHPEVLIYGIPLPPHLIPKPFYHGRYIHRHNKPQIPRR